MRILVVNKFWYARGGLERVMLDEVRWLEEEGHEVAHFSTAHPLNEHSPWADYFAPYIELGVSAGLSLHEKIAATGRLFHNRSAATQIARLMDTFRPDVVHAHGIHRQLSASVLAEARRRGIPVVHTLHDFHHICPADILLRTDGRPCDPIRCHKPFYWAAVEGRCFRGSAAASALSAFELGWTNSSPLYAGCVTRYVVPSVFAASRILAEERSMPVSVVPNAVPLQTLETARGEHLLFVGSLTEAKGADLLKDVARLPWPVRSVGDGPLASELASAGVDLAGALSRDEVIREMAGAALVLVPSRCMETFSMVAAEALSVGTPVVAADSGALGEVVRDGKDGLLFDPASPHALTSAIETLMNDRALRERMGHAGRQGVRRKFSRSSHLSQLLDVYASVVESPLSTGFRLKKEPRR